MIDLPVNIYTAMEDFVKRQYTVSTGAGGFWPTTFANLNENSRPPPPPKKKKKNKTRRGPRPSKRLRRGMMKHSGGRQKPRWLMETIMECRESQTH
jgi:hypothetical protein